MSLKLAVAYQDIHKDVVEACKKGDSRSQYKLYQLYSRAMFNICYRMMNNREEAEDMLQESFSEAFLKLDTFRYESNFGAWLKRIVINKCINEIKRKKTEVFYVDDVYTLEKNKDEEYVDVEEIKLNVQKVQKVMEELPEGYRIIFSLYLLEGYDHKEISEILGITESTSKSQYMRAKQKIRNILNTMQNEG
ncbi:RNA polymerase sigma factor [Bacteroidota bacterium]